MFIKIMNKDDNGNIVVSIEECYKVVLVHIVKGGEYYKDDGINRALLFIYSQAYPDAPSECNDTLIEYRDDTEVYYLNSSGQTIDKIV